MVRTHPHRDEIGAWQVTVWTLTGSGLPGQVRQVGGHGHRGDRAYRAGDSGYGAARRPAECVEAVRWDRRPPPPLGAGSSTPRPRRTVSRAGPLSEQLADLIPGGVPVVPVLGTHVGERGHRRPVGGQHRGVPQCDETQCCAGFRQRPAGGRSSCPRPSTVSPSSTSRLRRRRRANDRSPRCARGVPGGDHDARRRDALAVRRAPPRDHAGDPPRRAPVLWARARRPGVVLGVVGHQISSTRRPRRGEHRLEWSPIQRRDRDHHTTESASGAP